MTDGDSTGEQSGASHRPVQVDRRPLHQDEPQNLAELFLRVMPSRQRHDAIIYKREGKWRETSSTDFVERVRAVAAGLSALGLSKGDRVAIFAPNCPEWTLVDAACQVVG
ncbi:MAG: AMP-binding protein, partial [Acidobacteriota bacterium]